MTRSLASIAAAAAEFTLDGVSIEQGRFEAVHQLVDQAAPEEARAYIRARMAQQLD